MRFSPFVLLLLITCPCSTDALPLSFTETIGDTAERFIEVTQQRVRGLFNFVFGGDEPEPDRNPEIEMDAGDLVRYHGYRFEEHSVTTEDGYILAMHRIPGNAKNDGTSHRGVVFIQHGLLQDSTAWLTNTPENTLPYLLADRGFDVWLGNVRGCKYSQKHRTLSRHSTLFWHWTWDEMAEFDLPAMLQYTLNTTKADSLAYVGHSQGTMMAFAGLADLQSQVHTFYALAPVAYLKELSSPIRFVATTNLYKLLGDALKFIGDVDFLGDRVSFIITSIVGQLCVLTHLGQGLCQNVLFLLVGTDTKNFEISRLPVYLSHSPSGTSLANMLHYAQAINSGEFQKYDFEDENPSHYNGSTSPPLYDLSLITIPLVVFSGGNDSLADPKDVQHTLSEYGGTYIDHFIDYYDHLDFIWGNDVGEKVYLPLIDHLNTATRRTV